MGIFLFVYGQKHIYLGQFVALHMNAYRDLKYGLMHWNSTYYSDPHSQ